MQIKLNDNSEIISYALVGSLENSIEVEIPDAVLEDNPLSYTYIDGEFVKNEDYETSAILPNLKAEKIAQTKTALTEYLGNNPLKSSCHASKETYYNVTTEKRNQLANAFSAHVMFEQQGLTDVMTWNDTGNVCEVWTDAECIQLLKEIKDYVTPLVSKQQHLEIEINACTTPEEVEAIEIDYATA